MHNLDLTIILLLDPHQILIWARSRSSSKSRWQSSSMFSNLVRDSLHKKCIIIIIDKSRSRLKQPRCANLRVCVFFRQQSGLSIILGQRVLTSIGFTVCELHKVLKYAQFLFFFFLLSMVHFLINWPARVLKFYVHMKENWYKCIWEWRNKLTTWLF